MTDRTYRALLIANSTFPDDPNNLPDLEGPRNDAALLRDALCDERVGLFPSDNVRLVTERTMAEILKEIEGFLRPATRRDTLLLYYTGHGILDEKNELYWCARDTRSDLPRATAISGSWVAGTIDSSAAGTTVIILDCCHSGAFKGGDAATLAGTGRFVLSSVRASELSADTGKQNRASRFTATLVEGLRRGVEDVDHDGIVKLDDLYNFVHRALATTSTQIPQKRFSGTGDVPIALRPRVDVPELPAGVVDPAASPPVLDVSERQFDVGEVWSDEKIPAERIMVINRGGGTLDWTADCKEPWVRLEPNRTGVTFFLDPPVGPHRANIVFHDAASGETKTVRISVRVKERPGPGGGATTPPADLTGEGRTMTPAPGEPTREGAMASSPGDLTEAAVVPPVPPSPPATAGEPPPSEPELPIDKRSSSWRRRAAIGGAVALVAAAILAVLLWRPWSSEESTAPTTTTAFLPLPVSPARTSCAATNCGESNPIAFTMTDVDPNTVTAAITYPGGVQMADARHFQGSGLTTTWSFPIDDSKPIGEYSVTFEDGNRRSQPQRFTVDQVEGSFGIIQKLDAALMAGRFDEARALDSTLARATNDELDDAQGGAWTRLLSDATRLGATTSGLDGALVEFSMSNSTVSSARVECEGWEFYGDGTVATKPRPLTEQKKFDIETGSLDTEAIRAAVNAQCPPPTVVAGAALPVPGCATVTDSAIDVA